MPEFLCIKDCFVHNRLFNKGVEYDLPEGSECEHLVLLGEKPKEEGIESEKTKPELVPEGLYWCGKCKMLHRDSSKVGKNHMKHRV